MDEKRENLRRELVLKCEMVAYIPYLVEYIISGDVKWLESIVKTPLMYTGFEERIPFELDLLKQFKTLSEEAQSGINE